MSGWVDGSTSVSTRSSREMYEKGQGTELDVYLHFVSRKVVDLDRLAPSGVGIP